MRFIYSWSKDGFWYATTDRVLADSILHGGIFVRLIPLDEQSNKYVCKHCGGDIRVRNPSGFCDHLYYPDNCDVCKKEDKKREI